MEIQTKFIRTRVRHEDFTGVKASSLLPDRVPTLAKIAAQFISGRPIDASLNRNLDYNDIEGNPMLAKGVDLADVPKIAKAVGATLEEATEQIQQSRIAKGTQEQVSNPEVTAPGKVE